MPALTVYGQVDELHRFSAVVPESIGPGPVAIQVMLPTDKEDFVGAVWAEGVAREWQDELNDPREDVYTLADGESVDESR